MRPLLLSLTLTLAAGCVVRAPGPTEVLVESAPPAEQVEVIPVAPGPHFFWVKGHWAWRPGWVWVPGHYERHRPGAQWVHGEWVRRGRHWVWLEGGWR